MNFFNTLAKTAKIRFYVTLFAVGVIFTVFALIAILSPGRKLLSTEGVIERIDSYIDTSGEEGYRVFISYTDRSGTHHQNIRYPAYSFTMKEGGKVKVLYDMSSPEDVESADAEYLPYIFLAVGVAVIAVAVSKISKGKKNNPEGPFGTSDETPDASFNEQIINDNSPERNYYFHWTGKLNQSYVLETPEREAVYEANCDHIGFFTPYRYTFVNRNTGMSAEHKVSHTVTTRYGSGRGSASLSFVDSSRFKIDDVNNWEYLKNLGYSVVPKRSGIKLNFDVLRHGTPVAYLEAAGVNILKDNTKKSVLGDKLPGQGLYKVTCKDGDIEGVFTACFCVSRVEFF